MVTIEAMSPAGSTNFAAESGCNLRAALVEKKVDLYDLWGKVSNCGGEYNGGGVLLPALCAPASTAMATHGLADPACHRIPPSMSGSCTDSHAVCSCMQGEAAVGHA